MFAYGAELRRLLPEMDMSAVAAFPDHIVVA